MVVCIGVEVASKLRGVLICIQKAILVDNVQVREKRLHCTISNNVTTLGYEHLIAVTWPERDAHKLYDITYVLDLT